MLLAKCCHDSTDHLYLRPRGAASRAWGKRTVFCRRCAGGFRDALPRGLPWRRVPTRRARPHSSSAAGDTRGSIEHIEKPWRGSPEAVAA